MCYRVSGQRSQGKPVQEPGPAAGGSYHVTLRLCGPIRGHPIGGCSWLWGVRLDVPSSVD